MPIKPPCPAAIGRKKNIQSKMKPTIGSSQESIVSKMPGGGFPENCTPRLVNSFAICGSTRTVEKCGGCPWGGLTYAPVISFGPTTRSLTPFLSSSDSNSLYGIVLTCPLSTKNTSWITIAARSATIKYAMSNLNKRCLCGSGFSAMSFLLVDTNWQICCARVECKQPLLGSSLTVKASEAVGEPPGAPATAQVSSRWPVPAAKDFSRNAVRVCGGIIIFVAALLNAGD